MFPALRWFHSNPFLLQKWVRVIISTDKHLESLLHLKVAEADQPQSVEQRGKFTLGMISKKKIHMASALMTQIKIINNIRVVLGSMQVEHLVGGIMGHDIVSV